MKQLKKFKEVYNSTAIMLEKMYNIRRESYEAPKVLEVPEFAQMEFPAQGEVIANPNGVGTMDKVDFADMLYSVMRRAFEDALNGERSGDDARQK